VVTWRGAQIVLLSAQGMDLPQIAKVTFTSGDRVRDVIHNFNADGFARCIRATGVAGRRCSRCRSDDRSRRSPCPGPATTGCRFPHGASPSWPISWSPRGWSTTSATRACAFCSARRGLSCQRVKTWKRSTDPDYEAKKNRVLQLSAIADGVVEPGPGDPTVVFCMDEFGPLNLQPAPLRAVDHPRPATGHAGAGVPPTPARMESALAGFDLARDKLYGHIKARKGRTEYLAFCRYLRGLHPPDRQSTNHVDYQDLGADYFDAHAMDARRKTARLTEQLQALGYRVTLEPAA
jgi:hypothetical protein